VTTDQDTSESDEKRHPQESTPSEKESSNDDAESTASSQPESTPTKSRPTSPKPKPTTPKSKPTPKPVPVPTEPCKDKNRSDDRSEMTDEKLANIVKSKLGPEYDIYWKYHSHAYYDTEDSEPFIRWRPWFSYRPSDADIDRYSFRISASEAFRMATGQAYSPFVHIDELDTPFEHNFLGFMCWLFGQQYPPP